MVMHITTVWILVLEIESLQLTSVFVLMDIMITYLITFLILTVFNAILHVLSVQMEHIKTVRSALRVELSITYHLNAAAKMVELTICTCLDGIILSVALVNSQCSK